MFINECLKQHSAHPHEVDHQLGTDSHRVFRSFKLRTADPSLESFQFSWSLFNRSQLDDLSVACPRAFTAALRCLPTIPGSSMLSTPIVLESLDSPLLLETAMFAIHALYTEFVGRCSWLFSIHLRSGTFLPKVMSVPQ